MKPIIAANKPPPIPGPMYGYAGKAKVSTNKKRINYASQLFFEFKKDFTLFISSSEERILDQPKV